MTGFDMKFPNNDPDMNRTEFFRLAFQYYFAGRFAFAARSFQVAANILHHAVEMSIKGHLYRSISLHDLRKYGHDLPRLWQAFVEIVADPESLVRFDNVIDSLHKFESIRYPGPRFAVGMDIFVSPLAGVRGEITDDRIGPLPRLVLVLEDIDRLVREIFRVASVNPRFYTGLVPAESKEFLTRGNPHGPDW